MKHIIVSFAVLAVSACALPDAGRPAPAGATSDDRTDRVETERHPIPRDHGLFPTP